MNAFRWSLAAAACSAALFSTAATRDELFDQAEADRAAGRYEPAVAGYTAVLRLEPRNGFVWIRRAVCLNALHRYQESMLDNSRAHAAFILAGETKGTRAMPLLNRAVDATALGDLPGTFADAYSSSRVDETYATAFLMIADTWYAAGRLAEAQSFLARAQQNDATLTRTYTAEGAAGNGRGKVHPDDAVNTGADFTAAGDAYGKADYAGALAHYDRLLATQPLNSAAWGNRGLALAALGRYADAVISEARAAAIAGSTHEKVDAIARHFTNRLNCWLDLGDADAALVDGELATHANPDGAYGWQRLAAAWYAWGDLEKAQASLAEAKKRDPSVAGDEMTAAGASLNGTKRLARTGDREALTGLVAAATKHRHDLFEDNPLRTAAISILDELLKSSPRDVGLLVLRAQAEDAPAAGFKAGTAKEAITWIEQALALEPGNGQALLVRGLFRLKLLSTDPALKAGGYADLDRAIESGAATAEAYSWRGGHAMEAQNFSAALADFTSALKLAPDDLDLLGHRASAYERLKRWPEAIADRDRLVELNPKTSPALANRADTYTSAGDFAHALADFAAALDLDPKNPDLFLGRAHAYRLLGQPDRALADLRQARELDPGLPELAADGSNAEAIEALRHDFHHALKRLSKSIEAVSEAELERVKAKAALARAEQRMRRLLAGDDRTPEKIVEEVGQAEKDKVADAEDYRDRAHALLKLKRRDEALADLDQAITLDDSNASARNLRGRIYETNKDYDHAFTDYDRAVALAPDDADFHRDRGDIWWERKDYPQALADYEDAVKLDAKNGENWFKRGNAKIMLNRFADAIADYEKTLELNPQNENAKKNRDAAQRRLATP